jgi:hypothetical protein
LGFGVGTAFESLKFSCLNKKNAGARALCFFEMFSGWAFSKRRGCFKTEQVLKQPRLFFRSIRDILVNPRGIEADKILDLFGNPVLASRSCDFSPSGGEVAF